MQALVLAVQYLRRDESASGFLRIGEVRHEILRFILRYVVFRIHNKKAPYKGCISSLLGKITGNFTATCYH